jgi:hypothetical protein
MPKMKHNETSILVATVGACTARGGRVTRVSSQVEIEGQAVTLVDDIVTYADGNEATVVDGAGYAACWLDRPMALVGSRLSNGDSIIGTPQERFGIRVRDGQYIPGLFEVGYRLSLADTATASKSHA